MFILHAAIVPTCVGLHAASSMAHWCQFFPVLVCAARACCKQARTGGGKGCMHEMVPCWCACVCCWFGIPLPNLPAQCRSLSQVYACAHLCTGIPGTHGRVCCLPCSLKLGTCRTMHAAAVVGRGFVIPGCVPGLVCPCCVYLYVSGGGRTCAVLIGPSPLVSMRIHMHGGCCVCSVHCNA